MINATTAWRSLLRDVLERGAEAAPTSLGGDWRGRTTKELLGWQTRVPMANPIVLCPVRKLGYRFMTAEAAWILSGSNRLAEIAPYARQLVKLSDDGLTMSGAYGPPFVDQVGYVLRALGADPASRQAVMTIWRQRPQLGGEIPCTVSLQWLIRAGELHCFAGMRSSDVIMGLPYDWFTFGMMSAFIAIALGKVTLGTLTVTASSQHLYRIDDELARECAACDDELFDVKPIDLADFARPDELVTHLWSTARREGVTYGSYLQETIR